MRHFGNQIFKHLELIQSPSVGIAPRFQSLVILLDNQFGIICIRYHFAPLFLFRRLEFILLVLLIYKKPNFYSRYKFYSRFFTIRTPSNKDNGIFKQITIIYIFFYSLSHFVIPFRQRSIDAPARRFCPSDSVENKPENNFISILSTFCSCFVATLTMPNPSDRLPLYYCFFKQATFKYL